MTGVSCSLLMTLFYRNLPYLFSGLHCPHGCKQRHGFAFFIHLVVSTATLHNACSCLSILHCCTCSAACACPPGAPATLGCGARSSQLYISNTTFRGSIVSCVQLLRTRRPFRPCVAGTVAKPSRHVLHSLAVPRTSPP